MKDPLIFKEGLKYTLRQYYTVATVAALFGCGATFAFYKSVAWATHKPDPQITQHTH